MMMGHRKGQREGGEGATVDNTFDRLDDDDHDCDLDSDDDDD